MKRSAGRSATAAAAYRHAEKIEDRRQGITHDYTRKGHVADGFIMTPKDAPAWASDRSELWNQVEAAEKRADAQVAREIEVALPREITPAEQVRLIRDFVAENLTSRGMVADVAIHRPPASDGQEQPHAHIMLTMRPFDGQGFAAKKDRSWNDKENVEAWRASWAEHVNRAYERGQHQERIDHRSYERRGIDQAPTVHLGPAATAMERRGVQTVPGNMNRLVEAANQALAVAGKAIDLAKGAAVKVMDRGAQIMAELAGMGDSLEEAMQIREAERILQERQKQAQTLRPSLDRGPSR